MIKPVNGVYRPAGELSKVLSDGTKIYGYAPLNSKGLPNKRTEYVTNYYNLNNSEIILRLITKYGNAIYSYNSVTIFPLTLMNTKNGKIQCILNSNARNIYIVMQLFHDPVKSIFGKNGIKGLPYNGKQVTSRQNYEAGITKNTNEYQWELNHMGYKIHWKSAIKPGHVYADGTTDYEATPIFTEQKSCDSNSVKTHDIPKMEISYDLNEVNGWSNYNQYQTYSG